MVDIFLVSRALICILFTVFLAIAISIYMVDINRGSAWGILVLFILAPLAALSLMQAISDLSKLCGCELVMRW